MNKGKVFCFKDTDDKRIYSNSPKCYKGKYYWMLWKKDVYDLVEKEIVDEIINAGFIIKEARKQGALEELDEWIPKLESLNFSFVIKEMKRKREELTEKSKGKD